MVSSGAKNETPNSLARRFAQAKYEPLVGTEVEILCEGPSKTDATRLMGRTRTNRIVVFEDKDGDGKLSKSERSGKGENVAEDKEVEEAAAK